METLDIVPLVQAHVAIMVAITAYLLHMGYHASRPIHFLRLMLWATIPALNVGLFALIVVHVIRRLIRKIKQS